MVKVVVTGCFDMLHSGHVAFLKDARRHGDELVVSLCQDQWAKVKPLIPEKERQYMCSNIRYVERAEVAQSERFEEELARLKADVYFMNQEDEGLEEKREVCARLNVKFIIGKRVPFRNVPIRSTTAIRTMLQQKEDGETESTEKAQYAADGEVWEEPEKPMLVAPRPAGSKPVVFVSGCYDLLHSGHVAFFNEAAEYGQLYVSIGSDKNILLLKKHEAMFPETERRILVQSIRSVTEARVCRGSGMLDFEADLDIIKPDFFFVNEDGHRETKEEACKKRGIKYIVGKRAPSEGLDARSSTTLKETLSLSSSGKQEGLIEDLYAFPWRICLAGGWLDQPWVSEVVPGCVIVVNIMPNENFKTRSGLATSTRQVGMKLWGTRQGGKPPSDIQPLELAYYLFGAENPPGSKYIAGSQDALGLTLPGINRLDYDGGFWPCNVTNADGGDDTIRWLEEVLWLVPLPSRPDGYDPLEKKDLSKENIGLLADASDRAWKAINAHDAPALGKALSDTMKAWSCMLPNTVPGESSAWCAPYDEGTHGYLFSGCGGGFLMVISEKPVKDGFKIKIKTSHWF